MNKESEKGYKGQGMEGFFANFYDKNARNHIMEQYRIWVQMLRKLIPENANVLEVAPGPGYLSIELFRTGIKKITGLDISESFVEISRRNAEQANVRIDFRLGNASAMPFADGEFSHIVCTSAFKNFSEPLVALKEMHRVLEPGGIVWISDMRHDVSNQDIDDFVHDMMKLKGLNALMTSMTFKYMLKKRAYTKDSILELISHTPFKVNDFQQNVMEFYVTMQKTSDQRSTNINK